MSPDNQKVLQIKTLETKPDEKKGESKRLSLGILGWLEGLEPTTTGITIRDSTN